MTRECDTATMGAPRQGINPATRVRGPSTGARTQSLPRPRSARPRHGAGACPAQLSRAGPSIAGAQLIAPRCCGRARVRARSRGVPIVGGQDTPPKVSGRPHWVRRPQPPPPTQASPWLSTADGRAVGTLWTTRGEDAAACGRGDWLRVWFAGTPLGACKPRSREAFIPSRGRRAMLRACLSLVLWRAVALALAWCGRAGMLHLLYLPVSLALLYLLYIRR